MLKRFEQKYIPEPMSGCWLWIGALGSGGYGRISSGGKYGPVKKAHRASWELFRGPIPDGLSVLHKCDVRSCVNPDHLWLGTQAENMADCSRKGRGRSVNGKDSHLAKLSEADVRYIKENYTGRYGQRIELAERFGVHVSTIKAINRGLTWKHI